METDSILFEMVEKKVGVITFNRPHVLNAFDIHTLRRLNTIVDEVHTNEKLRVVIFTGAGKAFSAGNDIKAPITPAEAREAQDLGRKLVLKIMYLPQITIAAISGYALGGGFELTMGMDFRYATPSSQLGLPEIKISFPIAWGGWNLLAKLFGVAIAKEVALMGNKISAEKALKFGILHGIFPEADLLPEVQKIAQELKSHDPGLVHLTKIAINQALEIPLSQTTPLAGKIFEINYHNERKSQIRQLHQECLSKYL